MARRRPVANRDANHGEIVAALRAVGCTIVDLAAVGGGVPDLLVGYRGVNLLVEVKDGSRVPSERRLRPSQLEFRDEWRGQWAMVGTVGQALELVAAVGRVGTGQGGIASNPAGEAGPSG